tara:strand:- start:606 stop:815 length:210 start_codon:yes stop_codon:yes gene_type:complete
MSKISYNQFNILSKEQLVLILKSIVDQSYNKMNNSNEMIKIFNDKYKIKKNLNEMNKDEIINILLRFVA